MDAIIQEFCLIQQHWEWGGMALHGFFAHTEWDTEEGRATLRLLLDCAEGLYPYPVRLDADALDVAVARATKAARMQSVGGGRFSGLSLIHI